MLNCGECLVNKIRIVNLVDMVCPECAADYRGVTEFTVAAVVPRPDRNSAPKAPCAMQTAHAAKLASKPGDPRELLAKPIPMIFEEKVLTAITRLRAVALDAEYQGSSGQALAWKIESIVADLESKELTEKDRSRLRTVDKIAEAVAKDAREAAAEEAAGDTAGEAELPPVLSIGNGQDTVIFTPAEPAAA